MSGERNCIFNDHASPGADMRGYRMGSITDEYDSTLVLAPSAAFRTVAR